jgi:PKD repeat protein
MILVINAAIVGLRSVASASVSASANSFVPIFQKGMSYVSWPPNFDSANSNESLSRLGLTNTEWVAICVFWYQDTASSTRIYPVDSSPSNSSVAKAISTVHKLGMKVMLKPMVDPRNGVWRGEIPPSDAWFQSYTNFINFWAEFSQENKVDMLCIGCEFNANDGQTASWQNITAGVRERYSGPITYAANWDHYQNVHWWNSLDYVGIDAYFPLTNVNDPTVEELKAGWGAWVNAIASWQATVNKPITFTEIGYLSAEGTNKAPWNYVSSSPVDLQEQVNCYNATFQAFYNKSWFYGFYWWNWETKPSAGGNWSIDYTPQNKPVQNLIASWYAKSWERPQVLTANFIYLPANPIAKSPVTFDASVSSPGWNGTNFTPIASYKWDFGDGAKNTTTNPVITHTYVTLGTFTVNLTVTAPKNAPQSNSISIRVTVTAVHGVAVLSVTPSPRKVNAGESATITVGVKNVGSFTESFNVTAYCNTTSIGRQVVTSLLAGNSQTLTFTWSTIGVAAGNYTIKAVASTAPSEINIANNALTGGQVQVKESISPWGSIMIPWTWITIAAVVIVIAIAVAYMLTRRRP